MNSEMMLLAWAVALAVLQMLVAATGMFLQVGLPKMASNRDNMPPLTGWAGRADRAHKNMIENLVLFAALIAAVVFLGRNSSATLLGAQIFLWARVAYAALYVIGIPWLRTGAWAVSMAGLVMVFLPLLHGPAAALK